MSLNDADIYSMEAEQALLASLLRATPDCVAERLLGLQEQDFYFTENQAVFTALTEIYLETGGLDVLLVAEKLKQGNALDEVGGADDYLVEVGERICSPANLQYYKGVVNRKALNRQAVRVAQEISDVAAGRSLPDDKIQQIQSLALGLVPSERRVQFVSVGDAAQDAFDGLFDNNVGVKTGYNDFDWQVGTLRAGDMIVIGARPSHGKTAIALGMAMHMARAGLSVLFYTLEMTTRQILDRVYAVVGRVDAIKIRRKEYTEAEAAALADALEAIQKYKIQIVDCSELTPELLRVSLKTAKQLLGEVDVVFIDYLQLMDCKGKQESRQQEVTKISRAIKAAAKAEEVPIVVLSQLNRGVENRVTKEPKLSDIRESGAVEQDADVVILLHQPDLFHKGETNYEQRKCGVFDVAKNRNGSTGVFEMGFIEQYVSFETIAKEGEYYENN